MADDYDTNTGKRYVDSRRILIHRLFVAGRELYEILGARVARARAAAGLTQAEVARSIDLSRASLANIEAGRQRVMLHQVFDLAHALRLSSVLDLIPSDLNPRVGRSDESARPVATTGSRLDPAQERMVAELVEFFATEDRK